MAQRDAAGGLSQQHSMLLGIPPANKQPKSEKKIQLEYQNLVVVQVTSMKHLKELCLIY